jgi:hypothetical protein
MEQELAAGLGEGQIAEFVENDEVETGQIIGEPPLAAGARLGLETIDQIDGGEEAPARAGANATAGDSDREMGFARSGRGRDMAPDFWRVKRRSTMRFILWRG